MNIHKFFKYMGLKIEKVITDSKIKNNVDYYQEFAIKKKDLQTAISAFKWLIQVFYVSYAMNCKHDLYIIKLGLNIKVSSNFEG